VINFSSTPPTDPRGIGLPLLRTPTATPLVAAFTCEKMLGCYTHFWGGRTVPHDATDCEPCRHGVPYRWHGYISAFDHRTGTAFLFETTARAAEPIREWQEKHGTLRGAKFEATRLHKRPNGRVQIRLKSLDLIEFPLPAPPCILSALAIIWNLPIGDLFEATPHKGHAAIGAERGVTALAKEWHERQLRNPAAAPPMKPNGELLSHAEAEEVADALAKVLDGNGRVSRSAARGDTD